MRTAPPRRAFTLTELLIAIGLLAIFALAASRLFQSTIRIGQASAQAQDAAGSFDAALGVLREDVWVAPTLATPDPATARVGDVTWTIKNGRLFRSSAADAPGARSWTVPPGVTFAADGATLIVRVTSSGSERTDEVRMASQVMLLPRLTS